VEMFSLLLLTPVLSMLPVKTFFFPPTDTPQSTTANRSRPEPART
jgi:hypothetical protein